jgi:hypothetical protein
MNYLSRQVFLFAVDWADQVNKSFSFDLDEIRLGFGAEIYNAVQQHVVQGWDVTVDARTNADIKAFEDFMAAITGPLSGFWFPTPLDGMLPQGGVSNTQFDILDQGLADTWADHPDVHLFFSADGVASQAAKITAVVSWERQGARDHQHGAGGLGDAVRAWRECEAAALRALGGQ